MPSLTELRSLFHSFPAQLPAPVRQKALHALLQHTGVPLASTLESLRAEAQETNQRLQQQLALKKAACEQDLHALEETLHSLEEERLALIQAYTQQREHLCQELTALDQVLLCLGEDTPAEVGDASAAPTATTALTPSRRARILGLK